MKRRLPVGPVFIAPENKVAYHLCDLPGHTHSIPVLFENCYEPNCRTWEQHYAS